MASKRTTMLYQNGNVTISEYIFSGDGEAYADMQGQIELMRMDKTTISRKEFKRMLAVIWVSGVVMTIHYRFDSENFWEA